MKRIKLLPENLINQIAAGEVIERPASVVKEIVENSIDAGSTKVEIEISNDTRDIRVADNGNGIHKDDVVLAFSRHATSKLTNAEDLWKLSTLGFRGEALASIISVAKVTCYTRTPDSEAGLKVDCENSEIKVTETGCAIGTTMEVKDLFYNIPARMKFLKKTQTELASIIETVQGIAISYPNVAISLINKGRSTVKTTGSGELNTVISEIYTQDLIRELVEFQKDDPEFRLIVNGFASKPDFTKSTRKAIYLFINGRVVKCPVLTKAIDTAYRDLIPSGRYPFVVLDLSISPKEIDVNVHPSKKEIRYTNTNIVFNFVLSAIKSALETANAGPALITYREENPVESLVEKSFSQPKVIFNDVIEYKKPVQKTFELEKKVDFASLKEKYAKSVDFYSPPQPKAETVNENEIKITEKPKVIGQLYNSYILIEAPEGLQVVDQHIAHERVIYERLKTTRNYNTQLLLMSEPIVLEPSELSLIHENLEILSKFGFEFEFTENSAIMLKQVPQILAKTSHSELVKEIITGLEGSIEEIENKILITASCKAAIKAGEKLSIWQMEELITDWQNTAFNMTCPHGRIISQIIRAKEIAGFFGRPEISGISK